MTQILLDPELEPPGWGEGRGGGDPLGHDEGCGGGDGIPLEDGPDENRGTGFGCPMVKRMPWGSGEGWYAGT